MANSIKAQQDILEKLKIYNLNPMQEEALDAIKNNSKTILLSPTGTGKTLAFLLPLIEQLDPGCSEVQALVIVPSRELAIQIEHVVRNMGSGYKANAIYGGRAISKDKIVKEAVKEYEGLRLFRQDPFQCVISFIISSNSNIQKIKNSLEKITKKFGKKVKIQNKEFFLFPEPEKIAKATIDEIKSCGVGYRAPFIKEAAKMVILKKIDFKYLKKCDYHEAKKNICLVPGIGNKVADCIMLFSLNKLESFPLDTWMIKILEKYYSKEFKIETKTITQKQYELLHEKIVNYFGPYCGYAQQYLFKMEREKNDKKWL